MYCIEAVFLTHCTVTMLQSEVKVCVRVCIKKGVLNFNYGFGLHQPFSPRTIYQKLGGAVSEEQKQQYTGRVEEMSPSIRYCAYNIGDLPTDVKELQKLKTDAAGSDILASKIDVSV